MMRPDFDPEETFSKLVCPRCEHVGMPEATTEQYEETKLRHVHPSLFLMVLPSFIVRCSACRYLARWPVMLPDFD